MPKVAALLQVDLLSTLTEVLERIEELARGPNATKEQILTAAMAALEAIPNPLLEEPRTFPAGTLESLDKIVPGASVPIHGRRLATWLHLAFPHECPMPLPRGQLWPPLGVFTVEMSKH